MSYAKHVSTKITPQMSPVRGRTMVQNDAGGYCFPVTWKTQLRRFLILGHEGGGFYTGEKKMTLDTVDCIDNAVSADHEAAVDLIVDVSKGGHAPKNDPAIFALAYIAGCYSGTPAATYALSKLGDVCRIGTHLFDFCSNVQEFRGWGRSLREAVAGWYTNRSPMSLVMQVTKYQQRNGWSHRDVLRKSHPRTVGITNEILQYVTQRDKWTSTPGSDDEGNVTQFLIAVEEAKTASKQRLIQLIGDCGLVREHIPTEMLNDVDVWNVLLDTIMERKLLTALIRNLGKLSAIGVLKPLGGRTDEITALLQDGDAIKAARLHPLNALVAQRQYQQGRGGLGKLTWTPVQPIVQALEQTFYLGFDAVEPTGKNHLLGVDVSGSMSWGVCAGAPLSCCEGAAVMAMVAARTEPNTHILGFCDKPVELGITTQDTLQSAARKAQHRNFGGTDCAAAMDWAIQNKIDVDVFCIYTDGRTWAGPRHVFQALKDYRQKSGCLAKLAAFQLQGGDFSIADPDDAGMMDFSGFDTSAPPILADFVSS